MVKGGCAEKAGIQPADIIIAVGEFPVDGNAALTSTLRRFRAGDTTTVTVYRAGQELTLTITFDERPQNAGLEDSRPLEENEMPENGSYDEWYDYFDRHFGLPERP
jgi:serine protease Do